MPLGLPSFSVAGLIGSIVFSGIGFVAFTYGKKTGSGRIMIQGGILMAYSYFITDTFWMCVVGTALTAWVWLTRND